MVELKEYKGVGGIVKKVWLLKPEGRK